MPKVTQRENQRSDLGLPAKSVHLPPWATQQPEGNLVPGMCGNWVTDLPSLEKIKEK